MNAAPHLRFLNIGETGFFPEERVVLRPSVKLNLMEFILIPMQGTVTAGDAEDLNTDVYWFPFNEVEAGDYVLLYTKTGDDHSFTDSKGNLVHVYYWGKERAIWRDSASVVAVLKITDWVFYGIGEQALEKAG